MSTWSGCNVLTIKAGDFLSVANSLYTGAASEAELRTAVGRVYYALFLMARDRLWPDPIPPRQIRRRMSNGKTKILGIHQAVLNEVSLRNMALGSQLQKIYDLRVQADYYPREHTLPDWRSNCVVALQIASRIVNQIQSV